MWWLKIFCEIECLNITNLKPSQKIICCSNCYKYARYICVLFVMNLGTQPCVVCLDASSPKKSLEFLKLTQVITCLIYACYGFNMLMGWQIPLGWEYRLRVLRIQVTLDDGYDYVSLVTSIGDSYV